MATTTTTTTAITTTACSLSPAQQAPSIRKVLFRGNDLKVLADQLRPRLPAVRLLELPGFEVLDRSELLSELQMRQVVAQAPQRFGVTPWRLAYSITRDGCNLGEFYAAQENEMACLLVMRDSDRCVFGGFSPCAWKARTLHTYYGSGESFVFRFNCSNSTAATTTRQEQEQEERQEQQQQQETKLDDVCCYRWSGVNCFFMLSTKQTFAMGGGEHFAFSVDANLRNGVTGPCSTYNSPPLAAQHSFSLSYLEAWVPQPQEASLAHEFRD